jgi:hypothetical protein
MLIMHAHADAGATATDLASELNTHAAAVLGGWEGAAAAAGRARPGDTAAAEAAARQHEAARARSTSGLEDLRRPQVRPAHTHAAHPIH